MAISKLHYSQTFLASYNRLPTKVRQKVDRQLITLYQNMSHPSLRVKKIIAVPNVWEGRVDRFYRFTFERTNGVIYLRALGRHEIYVKP